MIWVIIIIYRFDNFVLCSVPYSHLSLRVLNWLLSLPLQVLIDHTPWDHLLRAERIGYDLLIPPAALPPQNP